MYLKKRSLATPDNYWPLVAGEIKLTSDLGLTGLTIIMFLVPLLLRDTIFFSLKTRWFSSFFLFFFFFFTSPFLVWSHLIYLLSFFLSLPTAMATINKPISPFFPQPLSLKQTETAKQIQRQQWAFHTVREQSRAAILVVPVMIRRQYRRTGCVVLQSGLRLENALRVAGWLFCLNDS